jgi:4-carboxymuconolactone decarboxylase
MTVPSPELRLDPVPFAEWDAQTRISLLQHLRRPEFYLSGADDAPPMPVVMELFAHHVPLADTFMSFTDVLAGSESTVDPRQRELAVLRVAWRTGSGYEWNQHHRMGGAEGLTPEQLGAVSEGPDAAVWTSTERALLLAVDEMIDDFEVSDQTWTSLAESFVPAQLFELLFLVGGYLALAAVLNSLGLRGQITAGQSAEGAS